MRTVNAGTLELIPKKKYLKFPTLHSPFCLFFIKLLKLNCHPDYFGVYFSWWNHQMCIKMVHSNTKNAKSKVHQSQVCYLCTTHSSTLKILLMYVCLYIRVTGHCYWVAFTHLYLRWDDKSLYLKFLLKWLFFTFLLLVSQIWYWQNFACQFAKMFYIWNLVTHMTSTLAMTAMNVFMLYWTSHFFETFKIQGFIISAMFLWTRSVRAWKTSSGLLSNSYLYAQEIFLKVVEFNIQNCFF